MASDSQVKPLITFILFGYNQAHFVREAIEGAFAQTYSPLEIIFSDDCSTDGTFDIMTEMAENYRGPHKIILNRNEQNRGVGAHVNRAFGLASGEWIVTAASDDISDSGRCSRVMDLARLHPDAGAIGLGWRDIDEKGKPMDGAMLNRYVERRKDSPVPAEWLPRFRSGDFALWGMSVAWKTELVRMVPPLPPEMITEDEIYSFWAVLAGYSLVHDDVPMVSYRRHSSNASGYVGSADLDLMETRRIRRARINHMAWSYMADQCANPPPFVARHISPHHMEQLKELLQRKIRTSLDAATWWECGTMARLKRTLFHPERHSIVSRPREWKRILPRKLYISLSTSNTNSTKS